jgi:hypothetical protein
MRRSVSGARSSLSPYDFAKSKQLVAKALAGYDLNGRR